MPDTAAVVVRIFGNHWFVPSSVDAVSNVAKHRARSIGRRASLNIPAVEGLPTLTSYSGTEGVRMLNSLL
jgi:hypothetical protein